MPHTSFAPFILVAQEPSPQFLGLSVSERNRRVARRMGAQEPSSEHLPTLTVPIAAAITPALLASLPTDEGSWRLRWQADRPPLLWETAHSKGGQVREITLGEGAVLDVATAAARCRSAWTLLRSSGKPQDHWLSRHVHRRMSRPFSYALLSLGFTANTATGLTFLVGLAAAWFMAQTSHRTMIAGGLLFWFASIADGIDGEMARLTLSESAFGEQLDTAVDQLTYVAGLAGVLAGWCRQGIDGGGLLVAALVAIGTPLVVVWAMSLVRQARNTDRFFVPTTPIEHAVVQAARETGAPLLRMASVVFILFRREAFSFSFFLVSLVTARRAAIPALIALGLTIAALTLARHRRELLRSLEGIAGRPAAASSTRSPAPD
jgi:phosphatidylglycerophosphate synthase